MEQAQAAALLDALMNPDNAVREGAEASVRAMRTADAAQFAKLMLDVVGAPGAFAETQRQMACTHLRMALVDLHDSIWPRLTTEQKQAVKQQLLALTETEPTAVVRRALDSAVSALATYLLAELLPSTKSSSDNGV